MTDQAAIERFQALYAEHHARVYAYAVSGAGRQLADEVVSEVFLVAWRRLADVPAPARPAWTRGQDPQRRAAEMADLAAGGAAGPGPGVDVISVDTVRGRTLDRQRSRPAPPARVGPATPGVLRARTGAA